eukprot:jgi/Pico_ML_1/54666/g46.t1
MADSTSRKSPKFFALLNFWRNFGDPLLVPLFDALDLEFALASPRREDLAIKIITRLIERGKPDPELKLTRWEIQLALIMEQRFKKYEADKAKKAASQKRIYEAEINGKEDGQVEHEDDPMDVDDQDLDSEKDEDMWADEEDAIGKDDMELKRLRQHEWDIRGNKHTIQYDADGTKEDVNISHVKIKFLDEGVEEYEGSDVDDGQSSRL